MAETIADITIPSNAWVDINTSSGILVGSPMSLTNKGAVDILLYESSSEPSANSLDGQYLTPSNRPYSVASVLAGSLTIWAKAAESSGRLAVQEV